MGALKKIFGHSLFKSSLIYTLTDAVNKAVPFLILPILTHYLLPSEYGIVSNYNVYIYILTIFLGLNLNGTVAVNFYRIEKDKLAAYMFNVLLILFGSFWICLLLVTVFYNPIYTFLQVPYFYVIAGLFISFAQMITSINLELWQLEGKPLKFGIYQITQTILNLALTLILLMAFNLGWKGRIWAMGGATFIYGIFSLLFMIKRGYLKVRFEKEYIVDALKFGVPLLPHALSIWIRTAMDRLLLTKFYGTAETGLYSTGFQFALLISFITLAFNNAYIPYLYKNLNEEDDSDQLKNRKTKIVKFTYVYMAGLIVMGVLFTFFSFFVVNHFLSEKYILAKAYIPWAMISQVFQGMYLMFVCYIFYIKKTAQLAWITFSCSLLQVGLSYWLIQRVGPLGAAYSTTIVSFLNFAVVWAYSSKVYKMPWFIFNKNS